MIPKRLHQCKIMKNKNREERNTMLNFKEQAENQPMAVIKTNHGDMKVMLFPERHRKRLKTFTTHAKNGYYDGIIFIGSLKTL